MRPTVARWARRGMVGAWAQTDSFIRKYEHPLDDRAARARLASRPSSCASAEPLRHYLAHGGQHTGPGHGPDACPSEQAQPTRHWAEFVQDCIAPQIMRPVALVQKPVPSSVV